MNKYQMFDLTARVAVITGGSVGLGRQMAEGFAQMGANLVLCARKERTMRASRRGIGEVWRKNPGLSL